MPKRKDGWLPKEKRTHLKCKDCKEELPKEEFVTEGKAPSGLQRYSARCKKCYNVHAKQNWKSVRNKRHLTKIRVKERVDFITKVKVRCIKCGYDKCTRALDFHHIDSKEKEHGISDLVHTASSLEILKEEIGKCVVLCANCHRELHAGIDKEGFAKILDPSKSAGAT